MSNTKHAAVAFNAVENDVVALLKKAINHSISADRGAREAASLAVTAHGVGEQSEAEAYDAILGRYAATLSGSKHVKDVFSACIALLLAAAPVRLAGKEIMESGKAITAKSPEVLARGEARNPELEEFREIPASVAVEKFSSDLLKKAARTAREEIGKAKAGNAGGAPKKEKEAPAGRPDVFSEVSYILSGNDPAALERLLATVKAAGYRLTREKAPSPLAQQVAALAK